MRIDVSTKAHPSTFAEIDEIDAPAVERHRWSATRRRQKLYVRGIVDGQDTLLHRFLMSPSANECVDHIDGDTLNNCRSNLRICSKAQNTLYAFDSGVYDRFRKDGVHTVKRKLADGTIRVHRYDRKTRERLANDVS